MEINKDAGPANRIVMNNFMPPMPTAVIPWIMARFASRGENRRDQVGRIRTRIRGPQFLAVSLPALLMAALVSLMFAPGARAFTGADADTIFTAYNDAFYFTQGSNGFYRATTEGGKTLFWDRAEQMEMVLDVYERTTNRLCLTMFSNVFNGFITDHGRNWGSNEFNDDIMWMVIACSRGYQHTGNPAFRDAAKANFDLCYERAWSTNLGGGLWWKTANQSKNACVNGPGAIAAHLLYQICGDTNYLARSESIYLWERATLFDTNTGAVYDNIRAQGEVDERSLTYNQGTFVGAANLLGHTNDARLAADYTMNRVGRGGLMPRYGENGDGGGFNGICARWIAKFMKQRGLESRYQDWLQQNAEAAWSVRRLSDNLSWPRWRTQTPAGALHSWGCSSSVVIMQVVPPTVASTSAGSTNSTQASVSGAEPFPADPDQILERTCFQTSKPWMPQANLRSDVAIVYGIDAGLPQRIDTWRQHGYRIHVMTGVAWGQYQDYLYGRFDGTNHEDEAQTERSGRKIGHGGDVYYMCPGENYGKFLCVGVQRALDAGAEAIHLEEPEFWDRAGYSEGFKREWRSYYSEDWEAPHSSVDARWRASKLKYFLYRRALQQVFDHVQAYNQRTGRHVRCYVPTHSLLNYSQWCIVSPQSSLALLKGCDGYIAQVWTGTSREPNRFQGEVRSRTFETAFLEYGAMQNLVRATGRTVWYLNDPIEDNPNHDWTDYRTNWESTMVASLFQPDVWQYEVAPWPERVFGGRYPRSATPSERQSMPPKYATELQTVINTLNNLKQPRVEWDCGTPGVGVLVSDSLMFQRGEPTPSDPHLGNVYGLAMPLLKRGLPVAPVQLENVTVTNYLKGFRVLLLSYDGQKPLSPSVHGPLADWVRQGGVLIMCDADADPYLRVRDWWNSNGQHYATPREHLFEQLGLPASATADEFRPVGKGGLIWLRERPASCSASAAGAAKVVEATKQAASAAGLKWRETNYLLLRRGPYVIAAGLDESIGGEPRQLQGRFVNLFDPELRVRGEVTLESGSRQFLLDLDAARKSQPRLLASACKALLKEATSGRISYTVEGVAQTPAIVLLQTAQPPRRVALRGQTLETFEYSGKENLLWIRFENDVVPRELSIEF
jgi:predicted alpha-1,6-mannanase (GH76 family)